ncbi:WecB/TagA/CpsF family glycosyltransferase [Aestuariivivens sediminis]|uniref:WecB/TagA/CpsF family glycosyltransferase n=1 Tax=Aestuariivivens sediminis TaxID=2913557 RepID=UPI001F58EA39|nr:WecB/TagA/CpsF family glycosyltransferase [Aestuariivivens sediminis]
MKTFAHNNYRIYGDHIKLIGNIKNKTIINTINAHSYIVAKSDKTFRKALEESNILLPDGEGIVLLAKWIYNMKIKKIAGADIHSHLLDLANSKSLKCFYLGASQTTLDSIKIKQEVKYPNITFGFFSPPFKEEFNGGDNKKMLARINSFMPDILFVGMTAPKQEKWVHQNKENIDAKIICSIGAVFDFVAETKKRAPSWTIVCKMEWLYRSFTAWRLTKRYMYSTPLFLLEVFKLKLKGNKF